ncbi:MAG TPA: DUF4338 domain-containing protein, partial [Gammaproteobacteria bacterium]|nr:DUF4338 domain-containing protein [Gammaproteobacteria bacterium]
KDWHLLHGYSPVLLETFVELPRFRSTCYRAANWTHLGTTTGRGKLHVHNQALLPKKAIWIYPLVKNFRQFLCGECGNCQGICTVHRPGASPVSCSSMRVSDKELKHIIEKPIPCWGRLYPLPIVL